MRFFSAGWLSNGGWDKNEIWHKGSIRGEDEARTSNMRIAWHAQRKHAIPHSTMQIHHPQRKSTLCR